MQAVEAASRSYPAISSFQARTRRGPSVSTAPTLSDSSESSKALMTELAITTGIKRRKNDVSRYCFRWNGTDTGGRIASTINTEKTGERPLESQSRLSP
jgi:hypothetical protein